MHIPFIKPSLGQEEIEAAKKILRSGKIGGAGKVTERVEKQMQALFGTRFALLTTSCTHSIELAMMVLGIGPGDEVICPSFTFVSTANAIVRQGAKPVFAEIDEKTLNIAPEDIERRITKFTRAIIPVHYAGVACEMDKIKTICQRHNLFLIEDAAQGVGARYRDKYLGTIGDIGCYSFHITKNIVCGEGGAFLTQRKGLFRRAEILREKGTNRSQFLRGEIDKYSWIDMGSSYVPSDLLAAILEEQLKKLAEITRRRRMIFSRYLARLRPLEKKGKIFLPVVPPDCQSNGHIACFRLSDPGRRAACINSLRKKGIEASFHYVPLHSSPYGRRALGYKRGDFPITERVAKALVRLPIYAGMTKKEQDFVIKVVYKALT